VRVRLTPAGGGEPVEAARCVLLPQDARLAVADQLVAFYDQASPDRFVLAASRAADQRLG
jgi:hypothetical protein